MIGTVLYSGCNYSFVAGLFIFSCIFLIIIGCVVLLCPAIFKLGIG